MFTYIIYALALAFYATPFSLLTLHILPRSDSTRGSAWPKAPGSRVGRAGQPKLHSKKKKTENDIVLIKKKD